MAAAAGNSSQNRHPHVPALATNGGNHGDPITSNPTFRQTTGTGVGMATDYRQVNNASPSESSSETSSSEESSSSDEEAILRQAGVTFDLSSVTSIDGHAPLELVSQCVSCLMSDQHAAASLLCQKVLELEPGNTTIREMYPLLQERLRLDKELPTESSSSSEGEQEEEEEEEEGESAGSSSTHSSEEDDQGQSPLGSNHCHRH